MRNGPQITLNFLIMEKNKRESCELSKTLYVFGVIAIIAGVVCATSFTEDHSGYHAETNMALVAMYIAGGMVTGLGFFSLSVIVDACKKYLDKD